MNMGFVRELVCQSFCLHVCIENMSEKEGLYEALMSGEGRIAVTIQAVKNAQSTVAKQYL